MPTATLTPSCDCRLTGCSAIESSQPPSSTFAPRPTTKDGAAIGAGEGAVGNAARGRRDHRPTHQCVLRLADIEAEFLDRAGVGFVGKAGDRREEGAIEVALRGNREIETVLDGAVQHAELDALLRGRRSSETGGKRAREDDRFGNAHLNIFPSGFDFAACAATSREIDLKCGFVMPMR